MAHDPAFPVTSHMRRLLGFLATVFMTAAANLVHAGNLPGQDRFAGHGKLVEETQTASLTLRDASLRGTIAGSTTWRFDTLGDNLWGLAALYLNRRPPYDLITAFLNGLSNSDRITVTTGPVRQILDIAGEPQNARV